MTDFQVIVLLVLVTALLVGGALLWVHWMYVPALNPPIGNWDVMTTPSADS